MLEKDKDPRDAFIVDISDLGILANSVTTKYAKIMSGYPYYEVDPSGEHEKDRYKPVVCNKVFSRYLAGGKMEFRVLVNKLDEKGRVTGEQHFVDASTLVQKLTETPDHLHWVKQQVISNSGATGKIISIYSDGGVMLDGTDSRGYTILDTINASELTPAFDAQGSASISEKQKKQLPSLDVRNSDIQGPASSTSSQANI
jgi:hypothetical protein